MELHLSRSVDDSVREGRFDLELIDGDRIGTRKVGVTYLERGAQVPKIGLPVERFIESFLKGNAGSQEDGLRFGQHLLESLFKEPELGVLWDEIQQRRRSQGRPLRMELILPAEDADRIADIPFELLADEKGFLFRRAGATLVRAVRKLPVRAVTLEKGSAVLVAWANPNTREKQRLPEKLFTDHEENTRQAAESAGLCFREPCRSATLPALETALSCEPGTPIVSLIAHGDPLGGATWLHLEGDPAYPNDIGTPVQARDLAHAFRRGKVQLALLWSCFSAKHHVVSGALATTLLQEDHGDLAAVVASHAAVRAESTAKMAGRLFGALQAPAGGDVEQAVSEARRALSETDLQWAAPVYYARPKGQRSVSVAAAAGATRSRGRWPSCARPGG